MLLCPVTKLFCWELRTVKCPLVSEWVTRANPFSIIFFRVKKISNGGAAMVLEVLRLLIQQTAEIFAFFCSLCKNFNLYISGKIVGKLFAIQTSTKIYCTPKCLFCGFVLFLRTKWVSLNFLLIKNSQLLINVSLLKYASSIFSTKQDILPWKSTGLKIVGRRSFTWRPKNTTVTWPSNQEFGPRPIM